VRRSAEASGSFPQSRQHRPFPHSVFRAGAARRGIAAVGLALSLVALLDSPSRAADPHDVAVACRAKIEGAHPVLLTSPNGEHAQRTLLVGMTVAVDVKLGVGSPGPPRGNSKVVRRVCQIGEPGRSRGLFVARAVGWTTITVVYPGVVEPIPPGGQASGLDLIYSLLVKVVKPSPRRD
jgi:hypothetical protein